MAETDVCNVLTVRYIVLCHLHLTAPHHQYHQASSSWIIAVTISIRPSKLARHARQRNHRTAAINTLVNGTCVPSVDILKDCLKAVRQGTYSCIQLGNQLNVSKFTAAKYKWVLAEAARELNRVFFKSRGVVLSLQQDARAMTLSVRYSGCNADLQRRQGLLGMVDTRRWRDGFSENIKEATLLAIKHACTPLYKPPHPQSGAVATPDFELISNMFLAFEVFSADAAKDEQIVGGLLKGAKLEELELWPSVMPNLKVVHKDNAHASRRIATRGWGADPYLSTIHQSMVGRGCFIQKLQRAPALKAVFNSNIKASDDQTIKMDRVRDMGAIKPRWESSAKSYRRRVLGYDALIATAHVIMKGRHGRVEGKAAQTFLAEEDEERALQIAMMGDSADETMMLTKFFDEETFDISDLDNKLIEYQERHTAMFEKGLCLQTGLTQVMLKSLDDKQRLLRTNSGIKTIGGHGSVTEDSIIILLIFTSFIIDR